jgi:hypothetical protein
MPDIARLSDPQSPLRIEYSRPAMENIRRLAREGFMALPRVGMGVGGLLLGTREGGAIRLLDSIEIPCSHTGGPSFNLSDEEKEMVRKLIAGAGEPGVVGWYCSKTRGAPALGDSEMAIYREYFSKPGQISLMLRPSAAEPMRAAFFFRDAKGNVVKGIECDIDEWRAGEAEIESAVIQPDFEEYIPSEVREPVSERVEPEPVVAQPVVAQPVVIPAVAAKVEAARTAAIPEPVALPRDMRPIAPVRPAVPDMFAFSGPPPPRNKRLVWIFAAAALLAAGAAAFFTQDSWLPRPPLALTSTELDGNLAIRWNIDALRGIYHASMFVNDGGNLQSLPLDRFQINQGILIYKPKSERVTAKLSAGEASAIAVWLKPVPAAPAAETPAPIADVPPTAAAPSQDTARAARARQARKR